jgi:glycosyltransferase involved in cell wall biosynthesis
LKVVVFAHRLEVGGTQTNAIELAAALRDRHGVEPVLFATPGPMLRLAESKGLRFQPAPDAFRHPSPRRMAALRDLVRAERPALVHAWDWWQALEAYYAVHLPMRLPLVVSDMMMELTRILPKTVPTTFGTPEIADLARQAGRHRARALVPPVDTASNAPGVADGEAFRRDTGVGPEQILLVTVSRLAEHMKSESLYRTIEVVARLGREVPLTFAVVGEGQARSALERRAAEVNAALGRRAVVFTGALLDPRPAYAAADVVIGMGGSALRGMAFGKPVAVVGDNGFCEVLAPDTAEDFHYRGIYGRGDGDPGNQGFAALLANLAENDAKRRQLGAFAREWVLRHFSLEAVSGQLYSCFCDAIVDPPDAADRALDTLRTAAIYLRERRFLTPSRDRKPIEAVVDNLASSSAGGRPA